MMFGVWLSSGGLLYWFMVVLDFFFLGFMVLFKMFKIVDGFFFSFGGGSMSLILGLIFLVKEVYLFLYIFFLCLICFMYEIFGEVGFCVLFDFFDWVLVGIMDMISLGDFLLKWFLFFLVFVLFDFLFLFGLKMGFWNEIVVFGSNFKILFFDLLVVWDFFIFVMLSFFSFIF